MTVLTTAALALHWEEGMNNRGRRQGFIISASYKQPNMERSNPEVSVLSTNLPKPGNVQRIHT